MKLLVSDFDGTLFIDYPSLEKNIHAIQRFREEGNLFVINSGRNYTSLMKEIKQYQIPYDILFVSMDLKYSIPREMKFLVLRSTLVSVLNCFRS